MFSFPLVTCMFDIIVTLYAREKLEGLEEAAILL